MAVARGLILKICVMCPIIFMGTITILLTHLESLFLVPGTIKRGPVTVAREMHVQIHAALIYRSSQD